MTRTRPLFSGILSFSAAAVLAFTGINAAGAAPGTSDKRQNPSVARANLDPRGVAAYWTAERMRAAIPGDVLAAKALERGNRSDPSLVEKGSGKTTSSKGKSTIAASESPVAHIGKVFFTMNGSNYVCSGNSVASTNRSTVATAGHCVHEGPGDFATNFVFVPAYENGAAPYGKWAASQLLAPAAWTDSGDMTYDTGFAVVTANGAGQSLGDVVGGSGVAFNQDRGLTYKAFGYPAARPFNGETLKSCTGAASNDPYNPQFNSQGISCDMTGGSSGGPWLIGTSSGGVQNSVNSYGYNRKAVMYGPYWGSVIEATYNSAAAS